MRRRYGSLPAIGHAEAFLHQQGVHDFTYVGKGETAHGPVHIFTTDEGTQLHVGRLLGGDRLETRTVRARANSKKKKSPKQRDMALLMHLERKGAGAGRHMNKPQRGSGKGSGKLGRHPKHKGGGQSYRNGTRWAYRIMVEPEGGKLQKHDEFMTTKSPQQWLNEAEDNQEYQDNFQVVGWGSFKTHYTDGAGNTWYIFIDTWEQGGPHWETSSARKNGARRGARRNGDVSIEIPMSLTWARAAEAARDLTRAGYARKAELTLDQDQYGELCMLATLRDVAPGIDAWTLQQAFLMGRLASANR